MTLRDLRIVHRPIESLTPYIGNARKHSRKQIAQIARSISEFGFSNPVLVDENCMILAGHGRVEAARSLGLDQIPCVAIERLTESQKRAFILADNRLAQSATWDEAILADELRIILSEPTIDITLTGFELAEVDALLDAGVGKDAADTANDALPAVPSAAATMAGDLWIMGEHRLLCGNALHAEDYARLLNSQGGGGDLAEMIISDPPYNVPIDGHAVGLGKTKHREFAMASGEMSREEFTRFLSAAMSNMVAFSRNGSIHYLFMDWRHLSEMQAAGEAEYAELKNVVVWAKDNGGMGSFYRSRHEFCFVWKNGTAPHINNFELGQSGRHRTNVWNYRGVSSGGIQARESLALHPTVKPAGMIADAMLDCSGRNGIVLDPFAGSGTVFVAAHKVGRRGYGMEIGPAYCDVALERWQAFAQDDAILAATGERYADARARRLSVQAQDRRTDAKPAPLLQQRPSSPWARPEVRE